MADPKHLYLLAAVALWFPCPEALALIEMKSASYSDTWNDLVTDDPGAIPVRRTYNSRSLNKGIFGYRWCSDFETKIEMVSTGEIILTHCGGGSEDQFSLKDYDLSSARDQVRAKILIRIREKRPDLSEEYLAQLEKELLSNEFMWQEFRRRMRIEAFPKLNQAYYSQDLLSRLVFDGKQFILHGLRNRLDKFDVSGRLTEIQYEDGIRLKLHYKARKLVKVSNSEGRFINFSYDAESDKVSSISTSTGEFVEYQTKLAGDPSEGDLVEVRSGAALFVYKYDARHNLIRVTYPDGTWTEFTYNLEKVWVTSFRNRHGCVENYKYEVDPNNAQRHFWSTVVKVCEGMVTNNSRYEFFHVPSKDGSIYLQTIEVQNNDKFTRVDFDERKRNIRREEERVVKEYRYDPSGHRIEVRRHDRVELRKYESSCELPTARRTAALNSNTPGEYAWTFVKYEVRSCLPILLYSSDGSNLRLSYGAERGTARINNDLGDSIRIEYDSDLRKPNKASIDGVGEIDIKWDDRDEMKLGTSDVSWRILPYVKLLRDLLPDRDFR